MARIFSRSWESREMKVWAKTGVAARRAFHQSERLP